MKIYYELNQDNKIAQLSTAKSYDHTGCVVTKTFPELNDLSAYTVMDGKFVYLGLSDETKAQRKAYADNEYTNALRALRQSACFDICDRAAWYDGLTDSQKAEVREWRNAWLRITETFVIPTAPSFVDSKAAELPTRREVAEPVDNSDSIVYLKPTGKYAIDTDRRDSDMAAFLESRIDELAKTETDKRNDKIDIELTDLKTQISSTQLIIDKTIAEKESIARPVYSPPNESEIPAYDVEYETLIAKYSDDVSKIETRLQEYEAHMQSLSDSAKSLEEQKQLPYEVSAEELAAIRAEWDDYYVRNKETYYVKDQYGDYIEIYTE